MTFLEYVNIALQTLNEVPLTSQQLGNARGFHGFTKEAVNRAYFDIVGEYKWPWMMDNEDPSLGELQLTGERTLVPVTTWTQIPVDNPFKDAVDWSTIYYKDSEGTKATLKVLDWEAYEDHQLNIEEEGKPRYIVQSADGRSMGLLPYPEDPETIGEIYYRIWTRPSRFQYAEDIIPMPDVHFNVLLDGILHHMWTFRGDTEQAQLAYSRFEKGLKKMKQKYTNQSTRLRWV